MTIPVDGGSVVGISDEAYGPSWSGDTDTASSKNALYNKIETLGGGATLQSAYDAGSLITTTGVNGPVTLQNGVIDDATSLLTGKNNSGDVTFLLRGDGAVGIRNASPSYALNIGDNSSGSYGYIRTESTRLGENGANSVISGANTWSKYFYSNKEYSDALDDEYSDFIIDTDVSGTVNSSESVNSIETNLRFTGATDQSGSLVSSSSSVSHEGTGTVQSVFGARIASTTNGGGITTTSYGGDFSSRAFSSSNITTSIGLRGLNLCNSSNVTDSTSVLGLQANITGTVTNAYCLKAEAGTNTGTTTNMYGVHINNLNGTNNWGVYQEGSDDLNYFAGNVGIGTDSPSSTLDISGSISRAIETITTNALLDNIHYTVLVDATVSGLTIDLPSAATCKGRVYCIKKIDPASNTVTIDGNGTETIDGDLVKQINIQYVSITIQSDGSNWYIVAG